MFVIALLCQTPRMIVNFQKIRYLSHIQLLTHMLLLYILQKFFWFINRWKFLEAYYIAFYEIK